MNALLIFIIIISIAYLASVPPGRVTYLEEKKQKEKIKLVRADMEIIQSNLQDFYAINQRYPSNDEGLEVLLKQLDKESPNYRKLKKFKLRDPWGSPYVLLNPGIQSDIGIFSNGPDKISGNEDDIGNWNLEDNPD